MDFWRRPLSYGGFILYVIRAEGITVETSKKNHFDTFFFIIFFFGEASALKIEQRYIIHSQIPSAGTQGVPFAIERAIFSNLKLHLFMNSINAAILVLLRMRKMATFMSGIYFRNQAVSFRKLKKEWQLVIKNFLN